MDKHWDTCAFVWVEVTALYLCHQTQSLLWAGGWHYRDFQSHIMRHFKMSASSPVEGANAPLCRLLSFTVFSICREKVGQIFRYFVKTPFRTFWVLSTLTYQWLRESLRSQALCKYLVPLQLNHLTTDNGRNSSLIPFCFDWSRFAMQI